MFGAVCSSRGVGRAVRAGLRALGVAVWVARFESGVEPIVVGLAMGLLTYAYAPGRTELRTGDRAVSALFREQPTPELARSAGPGSPRRCRRTSGCSSLYHPWTSYLIVPLFALANAGIVIDGDFLARAVTSPITLGIVFGYMVGKPVGIVGQLVAGQRGSAADGSGRRSAGSPSPGWARSPASASPSPC